LAKGHVRLADVAKAAGVSQGTASNVFSRPEVVREEVRERVLNVARELGYGGPDIKGRLLRAGRVNAIGVAAVEPLTYFFDDPWARSLMTAIGEVCDASGTGIAVVSAMNEERLAWNINSALVDGFILLCVEGGERLVQLTRQRQLPFIALALGIEDETIPAIGIDNISGGAAAARHLLELGHRNIAILSIGDVDGLVGVVAPERVDPEMEATPRDRMHGYWQALAEYGIPREAVPIQGTLHDRSSTLMAMEALFSSANPPTAILAMSDKVALFAMQWLTERGLKVPEDVSIIGFDGVPEAATSLPRLTTVAQPFAEIARRSVTAILENAVPENREALDLELVVRDSTAAPRLR
jgi:DNA-binding LacI/PurR family transcriptional regulator